MSPAFVLRSACSDDYPALIALEEACFDADGFSSRQVGHLLNHANGLVLVAALQGRVFGAAYYLVRRGASVARLYGLAVDPVCRGQGVASALMAEGEARLLAQGYLRFSLEVRADAVATRRLYAKHGFVFQCDLPGYYAQGRAGVRMIKDLRSSLSQGKK